jgi:hypothetical protein
MKKKLSTRRGFHHFLNDVTVDETLSDIVEIYERRMHWINDPFGTATDEPDWDTLGEIAEMEDFAERGLGLS